MPNAISGSALSIREVRHVDLLECASRSFPGALVYFLIILVVWCCTDYGSLYPIPLASLGALLLALGSLRIWTAKVMLRNKAADKTSEKPRRLLQIGHYVATVGSFAVWGAFSGYTAFYYVTDPKGLLVMLSSAALVAGATTSLAPHRNLAFLCVSLISLPTILGALLRSEPESLGFALLSFFYFLFLLAQVHLNWRSFWTAYRLGEVEMARLEAVRLAAAKSLLLATMSHEVRTPMNGVIGMLELVLQTALPGEAREYAFQARASAINLLGVLNGILAFSRNEKAGIQLCLSEFELRGWLNQVVFPFAHQCRQKGVAFNAHLDFLDEAWYRTDAIRLSEVLSNLLSNAVKFTNSGSIYVGVSRHLERPDSHQIRFTVRDTGVGMPAAVQAQLFEPFGHSTVAAGRRGAGLGLAITRQILDAMGGRITLDSQPGKGSEFVVSLSMEPVAIHSLPAAESQSFEQIETGLRALVVEDDPVSGVVATRLLEKLGVRVDIAVNGQQALEYAAGAGQYDLFFLDVQLPDADGIEIATVLRTSDRHRQALIVIASANQTEEIVERAEQIGVDAFLAKPYVAGQLAELVDRLRLSVRKPESRA